MSKRANERGKPKGYVAPIQVRGKDGVMRATTTFPFRKDKDGAWIRLENIVIVGDRVTVERITAGM